MYDRTEVFNLYIKEKAEEINNLCKSLGIISFMSFCTKGSETETEYKNYVCGSMSNGIRLKDDQIRHHINVANGFVTIPPGNNSDDFDYDNDF